MVSRMLFWRLASSVWSCCLVGICVGVGGVGIYVLGLRAALILMRMAAGSTQGVVGMSFLIFLSVWWLAPSSSYLVWQMRRYSPLVHDCHFSASVRFSGLGSAVMGVTFWVVACRSLLLR